MTNKRFSFLALACFIGMLAGSAQEFPQVSEQPGCDYFPLSTPTAAATICTDANDYDVVEIAATLLADDVERVTGRRPSTPRLSTPRKLPSRPAVVAGTLGHSKLIDWIAAKSHIDVSAIKGKWESFLVVTTTHPRHHTPLLVLIGSDRRGTAFALTSLCRAIGVSPWYWWADVTPAKQSALYVEPGTFCQGEPSVHYRGIFINDERFGGWARWAEQHFDKASGKVGPKTYQRVFELLLRLKANYLWPAMHPGTQAFNADPENARLADRYAIVMGSSHCEQMLRNNEGEWKAVGTYGDFNYITNRPTMLNYWEERVKTNGQYENTYTLGLRGIHDYPMEGANTTQERVALMQQAIDDQRDMLRRNIAKPIEQIPQVLCTYEEVLDAYHNGLRVPPDVTLLWSDDKHGYCRNLSNPDEQQRSGGAGIYYHLSYHGDPASWIWLSPLSPAFLATELTKAYTFGARKIWVFNVGDIKPAEKEISFVMDLAWDINRWPPQQAALYTAHWAGQTFGPAVAADIGRLQARYYQLQAAGKDAHVYFVSYSEEQIARRLDAYSQLAAEAEALSRQLPPRLRDAYFELVLYPIRGASLINHYQLLARRSMARAADGRYQEALADADSVRRAFDQLNQLTHRYNEDICHGKWRHFFSWQPYHWFRSEQIDPPICTPELVRQAANMPAACMLNVDESLSPRGTVIQSEVQAEVPLWIEALTPIRNFSKEAADNVFCHVATDSDSFAASATPINNVWHATHVGPMWSRVGTIHLHQGQNHLRIDSLKPDASIERIYMGLWPPFPPQPRLTIPAHAYQRKHDAAEGQLQRIPQLGFSDGMMVLPFNTPSYAPQESQTAPYLEYHLDIAPNDSAIDILTLPTLHVYEGRDARYAVQLGSQGALQVFSIHANDFTPEWRWNVLRGYALRSIALPPGTTGKQTLRIYFLDPGIVMQEIRIR